MLITFQNVCGQCSKLIWQVPPKPRRYPMTFNCVCRIDQDMHGKVETVAAAVPEWSPPHRPLLQEEENVVSNTCRLYVSALFDVTENCCIRKVPFLNQCCLLHYQTLFFLFFFKQLNPSAFCSHAVSNLCIKSQTGLTDVPFLLLYLHFI